MDKSSLLWIFVIVACAVGSSGGTKKDGAARRVRSATGNDPGLHGLIGSFVKTGKRHDAPKPKPVPDCGEHQACYEVLRQNDGTYQPIRACKCTNGRHPPCDKNWEKQNSGLVLTYRHIKTSGETVRIQLKFCTAHFRDKVRCEGAEIAAKARVFHSSTKTLSEIKCLCPDDSPFELVSWTNLDTANMEYVYNCQQPTCAEMDMCAEVEKDGDYLKQVKYKCNCPNYEKCDIDSDHSDQDGNSFFYKCTPHFG